MDGVYCAVSFYVGYWQIRSTKLVISWLIVVLHISFWSHSVSIEPFYTLILVSFRFVALRVPTKIFLITFWTLYVYVPIPNLEISIFPLLSAFRYLEEVCYFGEQMVTYNKWLRILLLVGGLLFYWIVVLYFDNNLCHPACWW